MAPAEVVSFVVVFEVNRGSFSTCALRFKVEVDKSMKKTRIDEMDAHNPIENRIS